MICAMASNRSSIHVRYASEFSSCVNPAGTSKMNDGSYNGNARWSGISASRESGWRSCRALVNMSTSQRGNTDTYSNRRQVRPCASCIRVVIAAASKEKCFNVPIVNNAADAPSQATLARVQRPIPYFTGITGQSVHSTLKHNKVGQERLFDRFD